MPLDQPHAARMEGEAALGHDPVTEGKTTTISRRKTSLSPTFINRIILPLFASLFPFFLVITFFQLGNLNSCFTANALLHSTSTKGGAHQFAFLPIDYCPSNPFLQPQIPSMYSTLSSNSIYLALVTKPPSQKKAVQPAHAKDRQESLIWSERAESVRSAFRHAWKGYSRDAFGYDEYHPLSRKGTNLVPGGIGFMIVDSLDTMMIMGLDSEYEEARQWIEKSLTFDVEKEVSLFETTIRVLAGLLSAHFLSSGEAPLGVPHADYGPDDGPLYPTPIGREDHPMSFQLANSKQLYLAKAVDLADRLLGAFDHGSGSGIPASGVFLGSRTPKFAGWNNGAISTAEAGTLQLEFRELSRLTGDMKYWQAAEVIMSSIYYLEKVDGLAPLFMDPVTGRFHGEEFSVGARGDSYYEYLLKQYLQTSHAEPIFRKMYDDAILGIRTRLVSRSWPSNFTFVGELRSGRDYSEKLNAKMEHLACFLPGTLALGATTGYPISEFSEMSDSLNLRPNVAASSPEGKKAKTKSMPDPMPKVLSSTALQDLALSISLLETCYQMHSTPTGLPPDLVHFTTQPPKSTDSSEKKIPELSSGSTESYSLLRPETVESLFVLYRITGLRKYKEYGWEIFQSIERTAKVEGGGYANLKNVFDGTKEDMMETFFLAETLKYLYLLFGPDDLLPLDEIVFNTEAHPLPRFTPIRL